MIVPSDRVRFGIRTGEVVRLERRFGLDGAVVWPDRLSVGDGTAPKWVPLSGLEKIEEAAG